MSGPACIYGKSPLKDVTNSTPMSGIGIGSPRKPLKSRTKKSNSSTTTPQRRSTRLNSLRSEPLQGEEVTKLEDLQSIRTTRSGRKVTPGGCESVTNRKHKNKKELRDGSVTSISKKRRSVSTLPSSPLAGKGSPQLTLATPNKPKLRSSKSVHTNAMDQSISELENKIVFTANEENLEISQGEALI